MSPAVLRTGPYRFYFVSHDLLQAAACAYRPGLFFSQVLAQACGFGIQSRISSKGTEKIGDTHFRASKEITRGME